MKAPRRRLHRSFLRWLKENRICFAIPLRILSRTDRVLRFSFDKVSNSVRGTLSTWEIIVSVEFKECNWDLIFVAEQSAQRVPGGYLCGLCLPGFQRVFASRQALWTEHLFEPLLAWVNEELSPAHWLVLEGRPQHFTMARLASERRAEPQDRDPESIQIVLPLRSAPPR